jgi:hypothetical protein
MVGLGATVVWVLGRSWDGRRIGDGRLKIEAGYPFVILSPSHRILIVWLAVDWIVGIRGPWISDRTVDVAYRFIKRPDLICTIGSNLGGPRSPVPLRPRQLTKEPSGF